MARGKEMTYEDRIRLEALSRTGMSNAKIGKLLGFSRQTIWRERKRGTYEHTLSDLSKELRYSCDKGQMIHDLEVSKRGCGLKIGHDHAYAEYLEKRICDDGLSPAATLGELKAQGREGKFQTRICTTTLYRYISKGIFLRLSNQNLPVKRDKPKHTYQQIRRRKRMAAGTSIEQRPAQVLNREEFGHWEMDSVMGQQGKTKSALVCLTERKTRYELIFHAKDHKAGSIVSILDQIERKMGEQFQKVFQSITVDNGSEFAAADEMERSILREGRRTKLYYCHPYCSCERGSNENGNRMIRRYIPKGTDLDNVSPSVVESVQDWMNNLPRRIHGYHTAAELFRQELALLTA